jgi:putative aldouronate transport system permease protein
MENTSAARLKSASMGWQARKKTLILCTMALPGAIWLLLLRYLPMFGIVLAFKDYRIYFKDPSMINNIIHSPWAGLGNFEFLTASTDASRMILNTIGYNAVWICINLVISVSFAIMLSEITQKFVGKAYQTMMFFPYFLSWVVASYFLFAFISPESGMITRAESAVTGQIVNYYGDYRPWPYILTIAYLWKNIGYSCILYLAAITGIDAAQYEAARIDGASKWQQMLYVTLPHLRTIIIVLFIMNVGKIFNADFGLFYSVPMNNGPLFRATQVIDTYVYRVMIYNGDIGMSGAAGLLQNVVGFICIMITNTIVRKVDPDSSLF